ncbi:MAG: peptidase [endosymbiont of Galathealinum brachiosum]|uniref:Peptidase n=1 Tax=endosymbiont of Galathealinum brachiosum TaxID=2200906 RepID=A0A370DGR9_9GAMM|nr:MAG: peptidase [endosymbiont of Galathealinum brachiosum]
MRTLTTYILLLTLLLVTPVFAKADGNLSKQQAMSIAQQNNPGRVLAVKQSGGVYRVKILNTNGEVRVISVDVNSGKVINR